MLDEMPGRKIRAMRKGKLIDLLREVVGLVDDILEATAEDLDRASFSVGGSSVLCAIVIPEDVLRGKQTYEFDQLRRDDPKLLNEILDSLTSIQLTVESKLASHEIEAVYWGSEYSSDDAELNKRLIQEGRSSLKSRRKADDPALDDITRERLAEIAAEEDFERSGIGDDETQLTLLSKSEDKLAAMRKYGSAVFLVSPTKQDSLVACMKGVIDGEIPQRRHRMAVFDMDESGAFISFCHFWREFGRRSLSSPDALAAVDPAKGPPHSEKFACERRRWSRHPDFDRDGNEVKRECGCQFCDRESWLWKGRDQWKPETEIAFHLTYQQLVDEFDMGVPLERFAAFCDCCFRDMPDQLRAAGAMAARAIAAETIAGKTFPEMSILKLPFDAVVNKDREPLPDQDAFVNTSSEKIENSEISRKTLNYRPKRPALGCQNTQVVRLGQSEPKAACYDKVRNWFSGLFEYRELQFDSGHGNIESNVAFMCCHTPYQCRRAAERAIRHRLPF